MTEYLLARHIYKWLMLQGLTDETERIFVDFSGSFAGFRYLATLEKKHNFLLTLRPGNPSPGLTGINGSIEPEILSRLMN